MTFLDLAFAPESLQRAGEIGLKLVIGLILGGMIGFERESRGHPAGLRTHMMVVLGCILFTEVSKAFTPGDPGRVAAQVVTGIGFLGAGAIIRVGVDIKGLTTAASIWSVAAIGMAVSLGGAMIWAALIATILALLTLAVVNRIELGILRDAQVKTIRVRLRSLESIGDVIQAINSCQANLKGVRLEDRASATIDFEVTGYTDRLLDKLIGIKSVEATTLI